MKKYFKKLMDLDEPILTKNLAPQIAPYAKVIYMAVLVILGLSALGSLTVLFENPFAFIGIIFLILVEFALVRMFCEYLTSVHPDRR